MENYFDTYKKEHCNGCGACSLVCPVNAITMVEDDEGFLYPQIDKSKCIKCDKCKKSCGNVNEKKMGDEKAYIAINTSKEELDISSSGGMFYILAKYVIKRNGVVCGVTYNENLEAVHEFAENLEECKKFCGSKYVRSNLQDSYQKTKEYLEKGKYVLFTGTACQVSGLKSYLNGKYYERLILCDILCHANPSPKVFRMYIQNLESIKNKKVKTINFRDKETGWKNQTPIIEYEDGEKEAESSYFKAFVTELINRPSCYSCQFATKRRITDFTIADFWGIEKIDSSISTKDGVSLLTVNSQKGIEVFENIKNDLFFKETDYDKATAFNHYKNVKENRKRKKFFNELICGKINKDNLIINLKKYSNKSLYEKISGKVRKTIKIIKSN